MRGIIFIMAETSQADTECTLQVLNDYSANLAEFAYNTKYTDCIQKADVVLSQYRQTIGEINHLANVALNCGVVFEVKPNGVALKPSFHASNFLLAQIPDTAAPICVPIDGFFNTIYYDDTDVERLRHLQFIDWVGFNPEGVVYTQQLLNGTIAPMAAKSLRKPQHRLNPYADRAVVLGENIGQRALNAMLRQPSEFTKKDLPILLLESHWTS